MFNPYKQAFLMVLISLTTFSQVPQKVNTPKNIIIIKGIRTANMPFSVIQPPVLEVTNAKLNIAVTDRSGNMLQINGIDTQYLKNGILPPSAFQTVMMMATGQTFTDNTDLNPLSLLEIKCTGNKPNTPITVGLKTTVKLNNQSHRVYATLSGIIPSYQYQRTNH